jgi:hydrogenase maturation protein HypF
MRLKMTVTGLVQGIGFRPFVYRLAREIGLRGYVLNNTTGVLIEAEGEKKLLEDFLIRIEKEKPAFSKIYSLQHTFLEEVGFKEFEIRESKEQGDITVSVLPDIATCDDCFQEITDPKDRRFVYLFTNCTNCGPRFTIIQALPYDRKNTSMSLFTMCPECAEEYSLSSNRRFHAEPNACHECGPWISLYDCEENMICDRYEALEKVVHLIHKGNIIAMKGIGGYHLICDATNEESVTRLRKKKLREEKPMAVMFPDVDSVKKEAHINPLEERALSAIERPVVIVKKRGNTCLAWSVSPDNSTVGAFLPYTPLHHILLRKLKKPVIATSANLTDEPIVKDEKDAFERLSKISDHILIHNREIVKRCDDSVVRIAAERQLPIRRSRGFAPLPVLLPFKLKKPALALGPYMNNTIALGINDKVFMSQHIGDLDTPLAMEFFAESVRDFLRLFDVTPDVVVSDIHPGYYSTKYGEQHYKNNLVKVQHHYAHILSCMAENDLPPDAEVIGVAFDGTGYGLDKTIWGSEILTASYRGFRRAFHLRPYRLPGGDKAVKEPLRTALSLMYETFGDEVKDSSLLPLSEKERLFYLNMIKKSINSPVTTSMGRLFDAVSSLIDLKHRISYHAQAAIALEQLALKSYEKGSYACNLENGIIDQRPLIRNIITDLRAGTPKEAIARKFHNTISDIIIDISERLKRETGISTVALSGGVFQNTILLEDVYEKLKERGFTPLIHQMVPTNDGGISLGQIVYSNFL